VKAVVAQIVAAEGVPDVWVNNAGVGQWGPFDPAAHDSERAEMAVNYHGSVNGIRAILPYWRERGHGQLIQITSSSALFPAPNMATYAASKAAIRAFVQSLRVELNGTGITITEIVPNTINTPMSAGQNRYWIPKIASIRPDLTPEQVAVAIHHAIDKRPREVQLPRLITLFHWLYSLFPKFIEHLLTWKR
jgi:short-subunit dehydrogenase